MTVHGVVYWNERGKGRAVIGAMSEAEARAIVAQARADGEHVDHPMYVAAPPDPRLPTPMRYFPGEQP